MAFSRFEPHNGFGLFIKKDCKLIALSSDRTNQREERPSRFADRRREGLGGVGALWRWPSRD